jgi:hypothetical protein
VYDNGTTQFSSAFSSNLLFLSQAVFTLKLHIYDCVFVLTNKMLLSKTIYLLNPGLRYVNSSWYHAQNAIAKANVKRMPVRDYILNEEM